MNRWLALGLGFGACLAMGMLFLAIQAGFGGSSSPALVVERLEAPPRLAAPLDEADLRTQLPAFAETLEEAARQGKAVLRGPEALRVPDYVQRFVPPGSDYHTVEYRGVYFYLELRPG